MRQLTECFSHYGLWTITLPRALGFYWSILHFEKLENQKQHQVHTTHPLSTKRYEIKIRE